jgi:hypothetical protein
MKKIVEEVKLKRKVFNVLFALVLVFSFILATFVPAMAQNESSWDPDSPILIVITSGFPFTGGQAVSGQGWVVGDYIALYINDEYVATVVAEPNAEGNASPVFDTSGWGVIEPGDEVKIIRLSDGLTKEHIVTSFTNYVNAEDDMVYGKADRRANMVVILPLGGDTHYNEFDTAGANGYWSVDLTSTYNITYGTFGATGQYDNEYDMTAVFWSATETSKLAPVATLVHAYGGLKVAAEALGFSSVKELQEAIKAY